MSNVPILFIKVNIVGGGQGLYVLPNPIVFADSLD